MPTRPPHPCAHPGCTELVRASRCPEHQRQRDTRYAREDRARRGTARQRGYDGDWERARAAHLLKSPDCLDCLEHGIRVRALDVDHVIPFRGTHDPLRLDPTNFRSLCRTHHNRKTRRHA